MTTVSVKTQQELDAALANPDVTDIDITSPAGVWLELSRSGSASVRAFGSASVRAFDSASVRAFGSASVSAFDSASVRAFGSASVRAFDSASVSAFDSASVRAFDSASVRAFDSASVKASPQVAVHLHSARAAITGGVVIDVTQLDLDDPAVWASYHGVEIIDGDAILYKATDRHLEAGHEYGKPTRYEPGTTVTCADWRDDTECGGGLHVSPQAFQAQRYRNSEEAGTRFLRVAVALADLRPIGEDKAKSPSVRVLAEVDADGVDLVGALETGASR